ncbi:MAG: hypothetical protein WCJ01_03930 [Ignavibacteria bacterium]
MKKVLSILFIVFVANISSFGQIKLGADIYSRYLWRGLDLGNSPSFQPSVTYSTGGLSVGLWGAYALSETTDPNGSKSTYTENDIWASYGYSTEKAGAVTVTFTDYYTPYLDIPFGHFKPVSGAKAATAAHTIEGGLSYTGPEQCPVSLSVYSNLSNDPDNSIYIQASYPFVISETSLSVIAGFVTDKSAYYVTEKAGFVNIGFNVAKSIAITDKFQLPINVTYTNNPSLDQSHLAFGLSLVF